MAADAADCMAVKLNVSFVSPIDNARWLHDAFQSSCFCWKSREVSMIKGVIASISLCPGSLVYHPGLSSRPLGSCDLLKWQCLGESVTKQLPDMHQRGAEGYELVSA